MAGQSLVQVEDFGVLADRPETLSEFRGAPSKAAAAARSAGLGSEPWSNRAMAELSRMQDHWQAGA